ncbi:MAG: hypothetical protein SNJ82_04980 [Gemmataceae bacterium]
MKYGVVMALLVASVVGAADLKPENSWSTVVKDEALAKQAPANGVLTEAKAFETLWKAYMGDEKLPKIDFEKNLVVVSLALGGPNRPRVVSAQLTDGNLEVLAAATKLGGPGFGVAFSVFPKAGIKKVNGKDIK